MSEDELKKVLEQAFVQARDAGKRDWNRMTIAVLKNRLLQLTARSFNEADFQARSLLELLSRFPEKVRIDTSTRPPTVEWLVDDAPEPVPSGRVRQDLWRAILDYSSGGEYEWDVAHAQAHAVQAADPARKLPTVDAQVLAGWRRAFADERSASLSDDDERSRLDEWADKGLGTQYLPRRLRSPWNDRLKENVLERLEKWFAARKLAAPRLVVEPQAKTLEARDGTTLRSYLHECIDAMTDRELESIVISVRVAHQLRGR